ADNPVARLDRPRYERTPPRQVPGPELMDALIEAAKRRKRPRDIAIFLILRYTGMRRESVASLRVRHLDRDWGLRGVYTKGGKTHGRQIGVPELKPHDLRHGVAMEMLEQHHDVEQVRALLGHTRVDTTQIYATIRPAQLKRAVSFYEDKASRMLSD